MSGVERAGVSAETFTGSVVLCLFLFVFRRRETSSERYVKKPGNTNDLLIIKMVVRNKKPST